uniref:Uncharacterized protein n=1 Tax=Anguilla anguilla TaxID=7936 RepID=A0A0E9R0X0_ANGAN
MNQNDLGVFPVRKITCNSSPPFLHSPQLPHISYPEVCGGKDTDTHLHLR